jgi:hypothetical protein
MPNLLAINGIFGSPPQYSWLNPFFKIVIRKGKIYQGGNGGQTNGH